MLVDEFYPLGVTVRVEVLTSGIDARGRKTRRVRTVSVSFSDERAGPEYREMWEATIGREYNQVYRGPSRDNSGGWSNV